MRERVVGSCGVNIGETVLWADRERVAKHGTHSKVAPKHHKLNMVVMYATGVQNRSVYNSAAQHGMAHPGSCPIAVSVSPAHLYVLAVFFLE